MAGVAVQYLGAGFLPVGMTHHWWWNNAVAELVWSFSVDVHPWKYIALFAPATMKVEVTRVEYHLRFESQEVQEREVHCWVKNTGDHNTNYELRMSIAGESIGDGAIVGAWAKAYWADPGAGIVNGTASFTNAQDFDPPRNLLAFPVLQHNTETDDQSETVAFVSEFVDGGTTKTGRFHGVAGTAVSRIVWALDCENSANNPLRVILFFG
jgi:hypothetical protein